VKVRGRSSDVRAPLARASGQPNSATRARAGARSGWAKVARRDVLGPQDFRVVRGSGAPGFGIRVSRPRKRGAPPTGGRESACLSRRVLDWIGSFQAFLQFFDEAFAVIAQTFADEAANLGLLARRHWYRRLTPTFHHLSPTLLVDSVQNARFPRTPSASLRSSASLRASAASNEGSACEIAAICERLNTS
jgi:hypothetical protein